MKTKFIAFCLLSSCFCLSVFAQNSMVTYQGRLLDDGAPYNGTGQFQFALVTSTNLSHQATATATRNGNFVTAYTVVVGGSGYVTPPTVHINGGGGSGAIATATINGGVVTAINAVNAGSGYTSTPSVTIDAPPANILYTTYWSNDGTSVSGSQPAAAVSVAVSNGLFTVMLGDTTQPNMAAIPVSLFKQPDLQLRIWFDDGVHGSAALDPAQSLTATPYAAFANVANTASNLVSGLAIQQNTNGAPNVILGASINFVSNGVVGATISGGGTENYQSFAYINKVTGDFGTVGGGLGNIADFEATVSGGAFNAATSTAVVGGGYENSANGQSATVGGGAFNLAGGHYATVGGGDDNLATGVNATVSGGFGNVASATDSTVGGGVGNTASGSTATIGGGYNNKASGENATIGGGYDNTAIGMNATIGGGHNNSASQAATVGGGTNNSANGLESVVGGGSGNAASGYRATIGGGYKNIASADYTTVGGGQGNTASGLYATVAGGFGNTASSINSFAGGYTAQAIHQGAFVWADYTAGTFSSTANNQFSVRATGGVRFISNLAGTAGVQMAAGGSSWSSVSDRNAKKNFMPANQELILEKLVQIPIEQWNYKWEADSDVPNIGPMAQDFKAAFYPGRDDKSISTLEFDGVELAAIQGLNAKVDARNQKAEDRIQQLETENAELKRRLEAVENILSK